MNGKECTTSFLFSRPVQRAAIAALCLWALACAAARAESVRAWPTAVIVDDQVRIGDVCDLEGFDAETYERVRDIVITDAPQPGGSVQITLDHVRAAMAREGVNLATVVVKGASRCAVTRPEGRAVPADAPADPQAAAAASARTLRQAVQDFFQQELAETDGRVNVQFGRTAEPVLDLSEPEFEFVVSRRSARSLGLVSLEVAVRREGKTVQVVPMPVTVSLTRPVVVARRAINAQAPIRAEDLQLVEMTFTQVGQAGLTEPQRAVGQRAKRFIAAGETLHLRMLEPVPLVHRGQIVDVHTLAGGIRLVTAAKAMQSGAFGDLIELRSHDGAKRTLTAVVTGPRRVEVKPGGAQTEDDKTMLAGANP